MSETMTNGYQQESRISKLESKVDLILSSITELRGALEKLSLIMESREDQRQGKCEAYRKEFWHEIDTLKAESNKRNTDLQTFKTKILTAVGVIIAIAGVVIKYAK